MNDERKRYWLNMAIFTVLMIIGFIWELYNPHPWAWGY
jgi:hypothetical protein